MDSAVYPSPHRPFGKRLTPPLTVEQKAQAATSARDAERQAMMARMKAYQEAQWEESMAKAWESLREAEGAIALRRLGPMREGLMQRLAGFALGLRLG